jgi:hypothetical protein
MVKNRYLSHTSHILYPIYYGLSWIIMGYHGLSHILWKIKHVPNRQPE